MGHETGKVSEKIARLIREKGWNAEDFARSSRLNRHTVSDILKGTAKKLRNVTISRCALALDLSPSELLETPIEILLDKQRITHAANPVQEMIRTRVTHPALIHWMQKNQERLSHFQLDELEELITAQGQNGAIQQLGVEKLVQEIERRRELLIQVKALCKSEFVEPLQIMVQLMFEKYLQTGHRV